MDEQDTHNDTYREQKNCSSGNPLRIIFSNETIEDRTNHDCLLFSVNDYQQYDWTFLFVAIFILAGCIGNLLVCLAVAFDRRLQNVTNYFLFSLAIADLLVTLVVMPLGAIPGFLGYWPFGLFWCNVYVTCDVLACSASIMHMCFISLSRYLGIRNPLKSRHSITKRFVVLRIVLVWLLSMFISSSITILGIINHSNIMPQMNLCVINNRAFFIFGSMASFYVPMIIMVTTYVLTLQLLREKSHLSQHLEPDTDQPSILRHYGGGGSGGSGGVSQQKQTQIASTSTSFISCNQQSDKATFNQEHLLKEKKSLKVLQLAKLSFTPIFQQKRNILTSYMLVTERKASKVLGIVFFTFVFCWTPFFILNIILAICPQCSTKIPKKIVNICLWLGYVSSTINPIIYTIFNATFRQAFFMILTCQWNKLKQPMRYRKSKIEPKTNNIHIPQIITISPSD